MVVRWPIEIDGLPFLKMVNYSMAMLNYQRVNRLIDFEDQLRHVETGELNLQLFSWMESNFSQI